MASTRVSYNTALSRSGVMPLAAFDQNRAVDQQQQQQQQTTPARHAGKQQHQHSVNNKHQHHKHDITQHDYDADHTEGISTDGTEQMRRNLEQEIRRGMGELQDLTTNTVQRPHQEYLDYSRREQQPTDDDDNEDDRLSDDLRQILEDESDQDQRPAGSSLSDNSSSSTSSRSSVGDDFSLKIGIAGTRTIKPPSTDDRLPRHSASTAPLPSHMHHHDDATAAEDSNELTYLSISRSASPPTPAPFRPASTAPASSRGLHRPTTAPPAVNRPEPVRTAAAAPAAANNRIPTPVLTSHAPRLTPYPPSYKTSPSTMPSHYAAKSAAAQAPPTPFNDTRQATASGARLSFAASPRYHYLSDETGNNSTTSAREAVKLPDVTGLTEGLQSPAKSRPAQFNGSTGLNEASAMAAALNQLRQKLASLERENTLSHDRVHELEYRLAKAKSDGDGVRKQTHAAATATRASNESANAASTTTPTANLGSQLRDEQQKREALEDAVDNLHQRVSDLTRSLKGQSTVLSQIQNARSLNDQRAKAEMKALRMDLNVMGQELVGLKNVLEEMLRQGEAEQWRKEQQERVDAATTDTVASSSDNVAPTAPEIDLDLTPKANQKTWQWSGPDTPNDPHKARFAAFAESRKSPSPAPARHKTAVGHDSSNDRLTKAGANAEGFPARPASAPLPRARSSNKHAAATAAATKTHIHSARSIASYDEDSSSSSGPAAAAAATSSRPGQPAARRRTQQETINKHIRASSTIAEHVEMEARADADIEDEDDLTLDFERARKIFETLDSSGGPRLDNDGGVNLKDGFVVIKQGQRCGICLRRQKRLGLRNEFEGHVHRAAESNEIEEQESGERRPPQQQQQRHQTETRKKLDPRQALENVLKDLEDDFELQKRIYIELSDRYRAMSSKTNSVKRKTLANHLKQSIDTLEAKASQVKRLHDLLHTSD
ncbi:hypothetical protein ACM66B_005890 [Microbotryomycetes sp. NB124-2]